MAMWCTAARFVLPAAALGCFFFFGAVSGASAQMPGYTQPPRGSLDFLSAPPAEPDFPPVQYLKQPPPASLRERVDRLLYGIKIHIPPEYDHYGYEIRYYMAHIAGPEVLGDPKRIDQELKNIAQAKIVHQHWAQELNREIAEIEKIVEEDSVASDARQIFKYNAGVVRAFLGESAAWIEKNEAMLKFLQSKQDLYSYRDPNFRFRYDQDRLQFERHYTAARKARDIINSYMMFMMMVY